MDLFIPNLDARETMNSEKYSPRDMTIKWQARWRNANVFVANEDSDKPKYYCYEFPPFPSGSLHLGHVRNYVIGDTLARFKRLTGHNVLYAQGFDSLGLPVEEAARKAGQKPEQWLEECISRMTDELLQLGLSYDHTRFISYHDPEYYKWTQWIFLKLLEANIIYRAETWVGWCSGCKTAVAVELSEDGRCWRCMGQIKSKRLHQWFINVNEAAQELWNGLDEIVISASARAIQQNWIGYKEGVFLTVEVDGISRELEIFTTKIELLTGMTFIAMAPEHTALGELVKGTPNERMVLEDAKRMCIIPRRYRMKASGAKGIFIDRFGIHPLTKKRIPIFIAPFVVNDFGTGCIFGCPAHNKQDSQFAEAMDLPIKKVVMSHDSDVIGTHGVFIEKGIMVNSGAYDGLDTDEAADAIASDLERKGCARHGISFSAKNWCISRQKYWSVPIPIIYCDVCNIVPVEISELPVELPLKNIKLNVSGNPLDEHAEFVNCICPRCGRKARRETSTLDTFFNSSWAYLRYCSVEHKEAIFDPGLTNYWMSCDIGIGGTEQITVGNYYFRVMLNILKKIGVTGFGEPWKKFLFHGLVMKDGRKMSKSLGNTVKPIEIINKFGVDALRFNILSIAKPENDVNWSEGTLKESYRLLSKIWNLSNEIMNNIKPVRNSEIESTDLTNKQHVFDRYTVIAATKIAKSYESLQFQRACQNIFKFTDRIENFWLHSRDHLTPTNKTLLRKSITTLLIVINPIVPHLAEELWERFGNTTMICELSEVSQFDQSILS